MGCESYLKIPKIFQNTKIPKKNTVQNDSQKKEPNKKGKTP